MLSSVDGARTPLNERVTNAAYDRASDAIYAAMRDLIQEASCPEEIIGYLNGIVSQAASLYAGALHGLHEVDSYVEVTRGALDGMALASNSSLRIGKYPHLRAFRRFSERAAAKLGPAGR